VQGKKETKRMEFLQNAALWKSRLNEDGLLIEWYNYLWSTLDREPTYNWDFRHLTMVDTVLYERGFAKAWYSWEPSSSSSSSPTITSSSSPPRTASPSTAGGGGGAQRGGSGGSNKVGSPQNSTKKELSSHKTTTTYKRTTQKWW
jgi:hypothetical protein